MNHIYFLIVLIALQSSMYCGGSDGDYDETYNADFLSRNTSENEFKYSFEFSKELSNTTKKYSGNLLKLKCEATVLFSFNGNSTFSNLSSRNFDVVSMSDQILKDTKVRWLKNEAPISSDRTRVWIKETVLNGTITGSLKIQNLDIHDMAFYSCIVGSGKRIIKSTGKVIIREKISKDEDTTIPTYKSLYPKTDISFESTLPSGVADIISSSTYGFGFTRQDYTSSEESKKEIDSKDNHITKNLKHDLTLDSNSFVIPPVGICQLYKGSNCAKYLQNQTVYIPYPSTQASLEEKLTIALKVISYSNEISSNCEGYAVPSLCFSTFPICRTPNETNALFFEDLLKSNNKNTKSSVKSLPDRNEGLEIQFQNFPTGGLPPHLDPGAQAAKISELRSIHTRSQSRHKRHQNFGDVEFHINTRTKKIVTEQKAPKFDRHAQSVQFSNRIFNQSRSSIPLRRVCKHDCEILENDLCRTEYAIAKRHPEIGQKLRLEECIDLPPDSEDCLEIGIKRNFGSDATCYWETGIDYDGIINVTTLGVNCMKWSHTFKAIPDELSGHNFCRNPTELSPEKRTQPWCYVEKGIKIEIQDCDVPKCSQKLWIYIISSMAGVFLLFITFVLCICCRHRKSKNNTAAIRNINLPNADKNIYGNSRLNSPIELTDLLTSQNALPPNPGSRSYGILRVPQYSLSQIKFVEELGEGAFGKVYKGQLTKENETIFVAVKALKENASHKTQLDFRREIELISELRHENIVCILGVVLREEPLCMLFEFMAKGDLHEFLMEKALPEGIGLSPMQFLSIAQHIAAGMEYLAAHHYVHRDLAARNCLVADNLVVKISDFGLSRDIYSSDYYRVQSKSLLPVRWMPPESILYGKFTTESDVWSYGVVLWEIYSYGLQPYYGYSNQEVISMVRGRELLQCPAACPRAIYNLMRECWHQTPARRPNFTAITNRLTTWLRPNGGGACDTTSDSSGANCSQRAPPSAGDPRERIPLIGHHSSSNGSLAGSIPRKLSAAGSIRSHTSARLMMSSSDVTSGSECEPNMRAKKSSCGSLLDGQPCPVPDRRSQRETVVKIGNVSQPFDI